MLYNQTPPMIAGQIAWGDDYSAVLAKSSAQSDFAGTFSDERNETGRLVALFTLCLAARFENRLFRVTAVKSNMANSHGHIRPQWPCDSCFATDCRATRNNGRASHMATWPQQHAHDYVTRIGTHWYNMGGSPKMNHASLAPCSLP